MALKSPSPTFVAGNLVAGRYQIEGVLGQGGYGVVYRATHTAHGRPVALKVLRTSLLEQPDALPRFLREAELAKRLEHPNTVRIYDFGTEGGVAYIALEMLRGRPLSAVIKAEAPMPAARVGHIASQVLGSLIEAHAAGIIHRDIKPANIFVCDFPGAPDFVKVLDFGIAKANLPPGQTLQALTQAGEMLGTPHYMAPEQAYGMNVTQAVDIYALGITMSEALSGAPVFRGTALEVLTAQVSPSPVPHRPEVLRSVLGPVVEKATQKDASNRYASAEEMMRHIDAVRSSPEPVYATGASLAPASQPSSPPGFAPPSGAMPASQPSSPPGFAPPSGGMPALHLTANAPVALTPTFVTPAAVYAPASPQAPRISAAPFAPVDRKPTRALVGALVAAGLLLLGGVVAFMLFRPGADPGEEEASGVIRSKGPSGAVTSVLTPRPIAADTSSPDAPVGKGGGTQPKTGKGPSGASTSPVPPSNPPAPPASSTGGSTAKFDGASAMASMDGAYVASRGCYTGEPVTATLTVTFGKDGQATSAQVIGSLAGTSAGGCIAGVFRGCKTKPYDEPEIRHMVKIYKY